MNLLNQKIALISGGSKGIGKAIVKNFLQNDAIVYYISRSQIELDDDFKPFKNRLFFLKADLNELDFTFINNIIKEHNKIDILVNNTGITSDNLFLRMKDKDFDDVINLNLKVAFFLTQTVSKYMVKAKQGSIINISSLVGLQGNAGQANYSASKAGLIGFTKSIAKELGSRNIRVNAIAPGFISTDMTDKLKEDYIKEIKNRTSLKRLGQTEEIANTVLFLASNLSSYITGEVINVSGGLAI